MSKKKNHDDGVAVRVEGSSSRYGDGVPVNVPSVPEPSGKGSQSGQSAATKKKEQ